VAAPLKPISGVRRQAMLRAKLGPLAGTFFNASEVWR
jgi:hypothetical protein